MLEKWNYIPWKSRFIRFRDNKLEEGDQMWCSIEKGPYKRPMIANPDNTTKQILEPLSKMTDVDACKNAKDMWEQIKWLMFGSDVTSHVRHSRLMDEFDKFAAKEGESLESVYERLRTLVNIIDHEYQEELQGDSQEDKITTTMMLLARAITYKFFAPTNNCLRTTSNTRNQAMIQDGRVDIQTKNAGYGGNVANVQCYNCNEKGHYARDFQKPRVRDAKYFREQMLLAMKDEVGSNLKDEENDFMLYNSYGDDTLEELTATVIRMVQIQPTDENVNSEPSYDAKAISEVNASNKVYEQVNHTKCKTIVNRSDDDQIDSNIIFDDPYVENNGAGFGYKNPERLKKAVAAQQKMYHGEMLHSTNLKFDSLDSEKTLEDVEESRLKMRNKMVQLDNGKLNALYETFVPQQEPSSEQTKYSNPTTSNHSSETKETTSNLPIQKMPKNQDLLMTISELKNKHKTTEKGKNVNTKFYKFETSGLLLYITPLPKNISVKAKKVSNTKVNADRSKPVTSHSIPKNKQIIMEYLVKISKKERILENKRRNMKIIVLTSYTLYPSRKIRRICACTSQETMKIQRPMRHVVDHIAKVLEMLDLIKIPNVDSHQLRMKVFPLSLIDDAKQWWIDEGDGKITTWKELVEKFFCKFYPLSRDGEDEMLEEGDN
ncbi:retrovirus-related pol polyprotein from transposon TNT 1-94 [Tanacetum coccineum]